MAFILGKKLKMTQIWKDGKVFGVTKIAAVNTVSTIRTKEKDGYNSVQVSDGKKSREFRKVDIAAFKVGDVIDVSSFKEGEKVKVSSISKGRGFQGVVKRHGFSGGPKTRGQKNRHRAPGSIGNTSPQRVIPGRRMAGHMGDRRITVKGLKIVSIDAEHKILMVSGAVPGYTGTLVEVVSL